MVKELLEKGNFIVVEDVRWELLKILNIKPVEKTFGHVDRIKNAVVYREGYFEDDELGVLVEGDSFFVPLSEIPKVAEAKGLKVERVVLWHMDKELEEKLGDGRLWMIRGEGVNLTIIEKRGNFSKGRGFYWGRGQNYVCGVRLTARCERCKVDHIVRKPCSREWCPECGKPESLYHRYMYLKVLSYGLEMLADAGAVGYLVITCPEELREAWKSKEALSEVVSYMEDMLAREGFEYGVYRWHFAGDRGRRFYPHLNILIPCGFMKPEKLERIKRLIWRRFGIKVVHYSYVKSIKKLRHVARYIARPTWLLQDEVSPKDFKRFRKLGIWGKKHFKSASLERVRELEDFVVRLEEMVRDGFLRGVVEVKAYAVLHGYCAFCYQKLKWSRLKSWWLDDLHKDLIKLGWGIWLVVPKENSRDGPVSEIEDEDFWYF